MVRVRVPRDRHVGTRCRGSHRGGCCARCVTRCEASGRPPLTPLAHLTPLPLAIRVFELSIIHINLNLNLSRNISSSWKNRLCRNARPILDLRIDGRMRHGRRRRWHRLRFSLGLISLLLLLLLLLLLRVGVGSEPQCCPISLPISSLPIRLPRRPRQRWPTPSPCEWQRLRDP